MEIVIIVVGILVIVIDLYSSYNGFHYATLMTSPGSEMNNGS